MRPVLHTFSPLLLHAAGSAFVGLEIPDPGQIGSAGIEDFGDHFGDQFTPDALPLLTQLLDRPVADAGHGQAAASSSLAAEPVAEATDHSLYWIGGAAVLVTGLVSVVMVRYLRGRDAHETHDAPVIPPGFSEEHLTDSMREIGKGRDPKAAISPFSKTGHMLSAARDRMWGRGETPVPAPAKVQKGRDPKAPIKLFSQASHLLESVLNRLRRSGDKPAKVRRPVMVPGSPDAAAAEQKMAALQASAGLEALAVEVGAEQEPPPLPTPAEPAMAPEADVAEQATAALQASDSLEALAVEVEVEQEPPPLPTHAEPDTADVAAAAEEEFSLDNSVSMEVIAPEALHFTKEFILGRHTFQYVDSLAAERAELQRGLRVNPVIRGVAEVQAMVRQDPDGHYWVRHVGLNQHEKYAVSQRRPVLETAQPTQVRRAETDHTVPADRFVRLEAGDLLFVDGFIRVGQNAQVAKRVAIRIAKGGMKPEDPSQFFGSSLFVDQAKVPRSDVRSPLVKIKYTAEIRDLLYGYYEGADTKQLQAVLSRVDQASKDYRKILMELERDLRSGKSHPAAGELRLLQNTVAALEDMQQLLHRELHQFSVEDVRLTHSRTDLIASILIRLRQLHSYQEDMIESYINKHLPLDRAAVMPFLDFYWQLPVNERRRFLDQVISVWRQLTPAQRELLWAIEGERRAALPPSYLRLITAVAVSAHYDQFKSWLKAVEEAKQWDEKEPDLPQLNMTVAANEKIQSRLERRLEVAAYLVEHREEIDEAMSLAVNIRELDLARRTYEALGADLQSEFRLGSALVAHEVTGENLPSRFLENYFAVRLSPVIREFYPLEDAIFLHRNGDFGFEDTFGERFWENSAKALLIHETRIYAQRPVDSEGKTLYEPVTEEDTGPIEYVKLGDIEKQFIDAVLVRIKKLVPTAVVEPMPVTHQEGGPRPAAPMPFDQSDLDERRTVPRTLPGPKPAREDFGKTMRSTPAEPSRPRRRRFTNFS